MADIHNKVIKLEKYTGPVPTWHIFYGHPN